MWSLISPRAKGISGSENFWSSPQKDYCNTITRKRTSVDQCFHVRYGANIGSTGRDAEAAELFLRSIRQTRKAYMRAQASEAAQAEVFRYCPKSDHIADMMRASVPER